MSNGILDWIPFFRKDPKEVVQKWRREIRKEKNHINRDIRNLMMEQKKVERSIKEAAQRNDLVSAKILAKELVRSRKAVARFVQNKATLDSLDLQMGEALRNYRLAKTIKSSTKMMESMNKLNKVPQLHDTVKAMAKEMAYAGFVTESLNDAIDGAVDTEDADELAEEAVDQVLLEITGETMSDLAAVPMSRKQAATGEKIAQEADDDALMKAILEGEM